MNLDSIRQFLDAAIQQAVLGSNDESGPDQGGGIPIGSVIVHDGEMIGQGHNRRVQTPEFGTILHGEMSCVANAGREHVKNLPRSVLFSTLSPCDMCTGMSLLYKIPHIVIGATKIEIDGIVHYDPSLPIKHLQDRGVKLTFAENVPELAEQWERCKSLMSEFLATERGRQLWLEDIGE